ncbi:MAG: TldD/PmbA family protein [Nitrospiraceae bacterium]|nr:MAG: TldD/PmbA family protein [Nitrospiraceae bacterium]
MNEEDIIKKALQKGCDAAEIYMKHARGISVEAKSGEVEALEASKDFGISIKVIKRHRLGFAFTTNQQEIEKTIEDAVNNAEWTIEDKYVDIPDNAAWNEVLIFDKNIKHIKEDDMIKQALLLEKSALAFDKRIRQVRKAQVSAGSASTTIANSKGIHVNYESTYYSAHVTTLAQDDNGDSQMGWDFAGSRRMSDIDVTSIGKTSSQRAVELLGSRKITSVKVPVILSPSVAIDFLEILSSSLSAEAVQKNRSFLMEKTGKTVMSPVIDIIDDGSMPWGTGTKPTDDEGVPMIKKDVISKGVLNGYFHNTYTAKKAGGQSTGNAIRGSFKSLPGVGVTNIYIKASGKGYENELLKSLSKGIVIFSAMGVHTANPVSGDFSIGISGLWIENGEVQYPFKEAVLSGNILEMFKKVEMTGNDLRFYGNTGSPSILIGDMDISA